MRKFIKNQLARYSERKIEMMENEYKLIDSYYDSSYENLSPIIYDKCVEKLVNDLRFYIEVNMDNRFIKKEIGFIVRYLMTVVDLKKEHFKEKLKDLKSSDSRISDVDEEDTQNKTKFCNFCIGLLTGT